MFARSVTTSIRASILLGVFIVSGNYPLCAADKIECESPACHSTIQNLNKAMLGLNVNKEKLKSGTVLANKEQLNDLPSTGCPIGIELLGNSTWNLLHTIAENAPEIPDETEQARISNFVTLLASLYPCQHCRVRLYIHTSN